MLAPGQRQFWDENGFLILPQFFPDEDVDAVVELHARIWRQCPSNVVVNDLDRRRRFRMNELSEKDKQHRFKVNDLYLNYDQIRSVALDSRLTAILKDILSDLPVLCNTLSLDYGTQQGLHQDSLYMTPLTEDCLVATWMALEDGHEDAGLLRYLPGSHRIPTYYFSNGTPHAVNEEMHLWEQHISQHVSSMGLKEKYFKPRKGDVFIWHSKLVHGGSAINDLTRTRKSLVSHYFGSEDVRATPFELVSGFDGGYWMDREPPSVPEQINEAIAPPEILDAAAPIKRPKAREILSTTANYLRLWKADILKLLKQ